MAKGSKKITEAAKKKQEEKKAKNKTIYKTAKMHKPYKRPSM